MWDCDQMSLVLFIDLLFKLYDHGNVDKASES